MGSWVVTEFPYTIQISQTSDKTTTFEKKGDRERRREQCAHPHTKLAWGLGTDIMCWQSPAPGTILPLGYCPLAKPMAAAHQAALQKQRSQHWPQIHPTVPIRVQRRQLRGCSGHILGGV